ncbi:hypothetical protein CL176_03965 [Suicoccus acidiformans]|uniref:Divergent PAP2 family protein n=1 Tax=Suicoccus acidiformans TaxID=2036206 RepID=A0A347WJJ8_9LACT|nr:divergent PAP2 family protein [Suicoccus acidiformans]AXY25255.1 hypothetical protein CL176_03965 [Suicoccus acidiformans]
MNIPLITSLLAIVLTQAAKLPIAWLFNRKSAKVSIVTSTGGMPSSHSAAVSSLVTALTLEYGFASPFVAITTVFGVIVMFDSMGVRRQSGDQGVILDLLARYHMQELKEMDHNYDEDDSTDNPVSLNLSLSTYDRAIIKKYMGHKPSEVFVGVLSGVLIAFLVRFVYVRFL